MSEEKKSVKKEDVGEAYQEKFDLDLSPIKIKISNGVARIDEN